MKSGALSILCLLAGAPACVLAGAPATEKHPHIGYVYPAGGQRGTTFEVKIGGEYVYGSTAAIVSGKGVTVQVTDAKDPYEGDETKKKQKRRNQTVIDEIVKLRVSIAKDAEALPREICLVTPGGMSNKLAFQVGQLKEVNETEPNNKQDAATQLAGLPVLINGQIMPGDVDTFKFAARKGQRLVVEASARVLIPYIADAVPGWFQALLTLQDAQGKEVAVADDFRFNPDPVLFYDVPANGEYTLAIRDSIYRGREDFVYRVQLGELPFITNIYPLGAPQGEKPAAVRLFGRNIPNDLLRVSVEQPGKAGQASSGTAVKLISVTAGGLTSNRVPFAIGDLPETGEGDASDGKPKQVPLPIVINGCIGAPGEKDSFCFDGKKGQTVCLEVRARRLGSPLDSFVLLMNGRGEKVGQNDDVKDRSEGMLTHVADSELVCALPEDGTYTVAIYDTQGKGGPEYAYRLRLSAPEPDFDLRTTPAAVSVPKGGSAPLFVHVIRKDGFAGEIKLALEDGAGLTLDGGGVPEGVDKVRLTITAAEKIAAARLTPTIRGTAVIGGKTVSRTALAAEDLMQAFIYQHLVPCKEQVVMITKGAAPFVVTPKLPESGQLELGYGKEVAFPVSVTRSKGFDAPIRLQLVDPPKGVVLKKGWIAAGKSSGQVSVALEANAEVKPRENLILSGIMSIEKAGTTTPIPAAKSAPATPAPKTPEKKAVEETTGGLTIGPRTTTPDSKAGKAPAPPPPPPKPADTKTGPPPERFTVTLPAIAIKVIGTPQPADPKAAAAPEKKP